MNNREGPDFLFKTILLGNSGAGKSSLSRVLSGLRYDEIYCSGIGVDFICKTFEVDGKSVKLQVWDTAGAERFRMMSRSYYRGAHGVVLVYDIADRKSFEDIEGWIKEVEQVPGIQCCMILVGNKCDLEEKRMVSKEEGSQFAKERGMRFIETSAKTKERVTDIFQILAKDMKESKEKEEGIQEQNSKTELTGEKGFFKSLCNIQ